MIIDATDLIVGSLASFTAKKALLGEPIEIVNCERAIVTGDRAAIFARSKRFKDMGTWAKGPFFYKMPDRYVRRVIRGMINYKSDRGERAYKSVKCYIGVPQELQGKKFETIKPANVSKLPNLKYTTVQEICKFLGAKQ